MNETAAVRDLDGLRDGGRLRDMDRWRDKIEVRLDNRQVFFLFFGSAVVACMLFVLGVIVGKRIESRGRADALEVQDPLAALDRAHEPSPLVAGPAAPPTELTFPKALAASAGGKGSTARADKSALAAALPRPIQPASALPKPIVPAAALPKPVVPAAALPKPVAPKPVAIAAAPKPIAIAAPKPVAVPKPAALPVAADATKVKGKYTLQLSAFPTREEADAFASKFDGTFVIPTEIPGKGTWYRVRCGNYGTYADATNAKLAFEKQNKVIALVSAR